MKEKKFYKYQTTIVMGIIFALVIVAMVVPLIIFPKEVWFLIIPLFFLLLAMWYLIGTGFFRPIYISQNEVRYKRNSIKWEDIKITAYPALHRSSQYGYYLLFGNQYFQGEDIKKESRKGFYVYLKEKPLKEILKIYKKKIIIISTNCIDEDKLRSTKKINNLINEHNNKVANDFITDG